MEQLWNVHPRKLDREIFEGGPSAKNSGHTCTTILYPLPPRIDIHQYNRWDDTCFIHEDSKRISIQGIKKSNTNTCDINYDIVKHCSGHNNTIIMYNIVAVEH